MPRSKKNQTKPKVNPFHEFENWLFDKNINSVLEDYVIRAINPIAVMNRFSDLGGVTVFLDSVFNNYNVMKINKLNFYTMLKEIIIKKNIKKTDLQWLLSSKKDSEAEVIKKHFPIFKNYEIRLLLAILEKDPKLESFLESVGLFKHKKEKLTKDEKEFLKDYKNGSN